MKGAALIGIGDAKSTGSSLPLLRNCPLLKLGVIGITSAREDCESQVIQSNEISPFKEPLSWWNVAKRDHGASRITLVIAL
jgi:hypothetical protein